MRDGDIRFPTGRGERRRAADPGGTPTVLLVEDDRMLGEMYADMLVDMGHGVIGPVHDVEAAMTAARGADVSLAVLDLMVGGRHTHGVADALAARGVPFLFSTGFGRAAVGDAHPGAPVLCKPFREEDLRAAVMALARERR